MAALRRVSLPFCSHIAMIRSTKARRMICAFRHIPFVGAQVRLNSGLRRLPSRDEQWVLPVLCARLGSQQINSPPGASGWSGRSASVPQSISYGEVGRAHIRIRERYSLLPWTSDFIRYSFPPRKSFSGSYPRGASASILLNPAEVTKIVSRSGPPNASDEVCVAGNVTTHCTFPSGS